MTSSQDFPTATIAKYVKKIRAARGISAERLSEQMKELGVPFDKTVIANLETGRRRYVTVSELLALSRILGVAPIDLLVPKEMTSENYEVTPEAAWSADDVRAWIAGEGFLSAPDTPAELADAVRWMPKARAEEAARKWFTRERQVEQVRKLNRAELGENPPGPLHDDQEGEK